MKIIRSLLPSAAVVLSTLLSPVCIAQTIDDILPDFTPEEAAEIGKAFGTYTSAVAVFTGRNAASTGSFSFDEGDTDFSVTSIPLTHTFGEDTDELRFRVRGAFGQFNATGSDTTFSDFYNEIEGDLPPELQGLPNNPDFQKDSATSVTLGAGLVYEPIPKLVIEPAFDLIWTHVKRRYDFNNFLSTLYAQKFDRDVFNNSTEAISYSPSLGASYEIPLGDGYSVTPLVRYTHVWSEDLWSKSRYAQFAINSGILQTGLSSNVPLPFTAFDKEVSLQPFFRWTNLNGAVKESLDEDNLYDIGSDVAFAVNNSWLSTLRIGGAHITASDFSGYRINLGIDF